jgi:hypothetical protein
MYLGFLCLSKRFYKKKLVNIFVIGKIQCIMSMIIRGLIKYEKTKIKARKVFTCN